MTSQEYVDLINKLGLSWRNQKISYDAGIKDKDDFLSICGYRISPSYCSKLYGIKPGSIILYERTGNYSCGLNYTDKLESAEELLVNRIKLYKDALYKERIEDIKNDFI